MDDEQKAQNIPETTEEVESPTTEETNPQEEPVEETPGEALETSEVPEETGKETTKEKPVEKRIHKLVDERDRERAEKESLARQVEELTAQLSSQPQEGLPQIPTLEPGTEVTSEQYKADVVRTAQSIAQLEVQKQQIIDKINREAQEAMINHPELNPKNQDVFNKELSNAVTKAVRAQIQANPTASVRDLVDSLMKPYHILVDKKVAEQTQTITKQVSETALRPTQVSGEETSFENLPIEEMEKKLGVVY